MSLSYIVSGNGTINAFANNRAYVIPRTHRNYERAKAALGTKNPDTFVRAVDYVEAVRQFAATSPHRRKVEIVNNQVIYNGTPLHNVITRRILELHADGWPWEPVANFLDNVQQNPSYRAIQELYTFLEHRALPLTENGCFLGYKAVRPDWKDKHSGTFDNSVGKIVSVPRNTVDDDFRLDCSHGLHVGSIEYVQGFKTDRDHVIIVRVNPKDVVSVPKEDHCTKLRTCEYEVVGEYTGDLTGLVYTSQGEAVPPPSRNDPGQGVTQTPPPRAREKWSGVDPGAPEGDKTVVAGVVDGYYVFDAADAASDADQAKNAADKQFTQNTEIDAATLGAQDSYETQYPGEFEAEDVGLGPKEDEENEDEEDDDSELDEDDSDLDDDDYDSTVDSDLEEDENEDRDDETFAEDTDEPAVDTASYNHPYNFNQEYGGSD